MNRWEDLAYLLGGLVQKLAPLQSPPALAELAATHVATAADVRRAVASIAAGKGVPDTLSATAAHCLGTRAMCALDFLGAVLLERSPFPPPRPEWSDAQVLEWLLLDLWERRSDHWLRLTYDALARGVSFY